MRQSRGHESGLGLLAVFGPRRALLLGAMVLFAGYDRCDPACAAPTKPQRPNIVLILADDLGWADVSYNGSKFYETPNIDALTRRGMRFTNFYAAAPICSPTRASIMTGKAPARLWITTPAGHLPPLPGPGPHYQKVAAPEQRYLYPLSKRYLEPSEYTLAEALRDAGYATAHIGKWHLGVRPEHWPERQGFEFSFHGAPDPGPDGTYFSPYGFRAGTVTSGPPGEYITDRVTDEAIRFIKAHRDRPFFLYLPHYAIHSPWQAKKELFEHYRAKADLKAPQHNPVVAAMIHSLDENVGRLMKALDDLQLADRTIVIFTSDNGGLERIPRRRNRPVVADDRIQTEPIRLKNGRVVGEALKRIGDMHITSNAPLRGGKGNTYEGGLREPTIFIWPGVVRPGSVCDVPAVSTDLYPTILEMAGVTRRPGTAPDGVSIVPLLKGASSLDRDALFWHFPHGGPEKASSVIRQGRFKLIHFYEKEDELYDLSRDLGETTNLARQMPDRVRALRERLEEWLQEVGAVLPKPNPKYIPPGIWSAQSDCRVQRKSGVLRVEPTGNRPVLVSRRFGPVRGNVIVKFRLRTVGPGMAGDEAWLYWSNDRYPSFARERRVRIKLILDGQFYEYSASLPAEHGVNRLRLDPGPARQPLEIDWIRVCSRTQPEKPVKTWEFEGETKE
ncbi:MAG: sulfatase [Planctomycetes bacterium]|nr:sulfatase [Planctomycetota bacterium]